ncbi:MAG: rhodanese-like domain-containing protein [Chitinophagia bacterium]|nr:rhodanese-like domain-containing protein [Chitinophagia bacterium]
MTNITAEQLKARMEAGEALHIIDVREPAEYAEFNLGGKLVPLGKIMQMQTDEIDDLKNEEIIVHCKAGMRSMQAAMFLEQMGYTNVVNLVGGTLDWRQKFGDGPVK